MKTKSVLAALMVSIGLFASAPSSAQTEPAIKVYPSGELLKVVFAYDSKVPVIVEFEDQYGIFGTDRVEASSFSGGFMKRYQVKRENNEPYWLNIKNDSVSARFKITTQKSKITSTLETVTYTHPIAKR